MMSRIIISKQNYMSPKEGLKPQSHDIFSDLLCVNFKHAWIYFGGHILQMFLTVNSSNRLDLDPLIQGKVGMRKQRVCFFFQVCQDMIWTFCTWHDVVIAGCCCLVPHWLFRVPMPQRIQAIVTAINVSIMLNHVQPIRINWMLVSILIDQAQI